MNEPSREIQRQQQLERMIGRVYFVAIIPFFGAAVAPWMLGHLDQRELPSLVIWSFTVLIFSAGAHTGAQLFRKSNAVFLHAFAATIISALGIAASFWAFTRAEYFAPVAFLILAHWLNFLWLKRSRLWLNIEPKIGKQHNRFVWTVLACHMFVLFNIISAAKTAVS